MLIVEMAWLDSYKKDLEELNKLLKSKNKVLVHHRDVDGSCCAAQFLKFFPDFKTFSIKDPFIPEDIIHELKEQKPETIIFVDIGVDEHLDRLKRIQSDLPASKICVIDHHVIQNDLNKLGMMHINPRFEKKSIYVPASLMVFDMLKGMDFEMEKHAWIACIGVISDYGQKDNKEFIEYCKKLYPGFLDTEDLIESAIGSQAKTIYSAIILKGEYGVRKAIENLVLSKELPEFEKNKDLKKWRKNVDKEITEVIESCDKDKQIIGNILFFEIKSKLNLASIISNIVSEKYSNKVIVISKKVAEGWKISTRMSKNISNTGINLAEIVKKATEGVGYGGGHPQAAGAFVENWEEFKSRLIKLIKQESGK